MHDDTHLCYDSRTMATDLYRVLGVSREASEEAADPADDVPWRRDVDAGDVHYDSPSSSKPSSSASKPAGVSDAGCEPRPGIGPRSEVKASIFQLSSSHTIR